MATLSAINEDDVQVNQFNQFFKEIGIIDWYNKEKLGLIMLP